MIIGNKETFAVELIANENNPKMGYGKLWLQNSFLGTSEDLIYLNGYLISLIDEIINSKEINFELENRNEIEIFEVLKSKSKKRSDYAVIGSTFTDDFEIYSYKKDDSIIVLWKLMHEKEMIFNELKKYSKEIQFATVPLFELEIVKKKVLEIIT
ncbi:hypothetical protein [Flavobacterium reichenbachii]|uniref:Uncharacterized protein n=1 Tax=Flavobacterium reichenbachii TaxID=362418 RepID=A0A085ZMF7_9FLAO|nr:hypothetical protein [Flavobacterium reichenbachii]KFF05621.1 hypothetical protein IW19_08870 [Flavobacterium reichenbachii]OXB17953.1 hypothetical protein B0A68_03180 [Flavobacterium reichenbachii]